MRLATIPLALALAGCADVASYRPFVAPGADEAALAADEAYCVGVAKTYSSPLSLNSILEAGAQGGAKNAAGAALDPLVPALGAVGGATSELLAELGVLNEDQRKVLLRCLDKLGDRSGKYTILDPNEF